MIVLRILHLSDHLLNALMQQAIFCESLSLAKSLGLNCWAIDFNERALRLSLVAGEVVVLLVAGETGLTSLFLFHKHTHRHQPGPIK